MPLIHAKSLTLISKSTQGGELSNPLGVTAVPNSAEKRLLWIRTVAGPAIGFGHLRRSIVLARMLSDCLQPVFLADESDPWTRAQCAANEWSTLPFGTWTSTIWHPPPAAILIDTRQEQGLDEILSGARASGIPTISIHDLGLNPLPSDIVVDGSVAPGPSSLYPADARYVSGHDYLVLDPTYALLRQRVKKIERHISSIFVNLGGGDSSRFFFKVLQGLRQWRRDIEVVGIRGFSDWGQSAVSRKKWSPMRFRWAQETESLGRTCYQADLAVTAGGLSAYEALCVGTPLLALSYDGHQRMTVAKLSENGACIDLGDGESTRPSTLCGVVDSLDSDPAWRTRLSLRGRQLIDGRGAERVSSLIRQAVKREAQTASRVN